MRLRWLCGFLVACVASSCGKSPGAADSGSPGDGGVWPFDPVSYRVLRDSPRKVFATWFIFRYTYDNGSPWDDPWSRWLDPNGRCDADPFIKDKNDSGVTCDEIGGLFRERPLPRPARLLPGSPSQADPNWKEKDLDLEISRAMTLGLDGFLFDITEPTEDYYFGEFKRMLAAAGRVPEPGFKIMLMPEWSNPAYWAKQDASGTFINHPELAKLVRTYAKDPAMFRVGNRLALSAWVAFGTESDATAAAFWKGFIADMKRPPDNIDVMFIPSYVDWAKHAPAFQGIGEGIMDWAADTHQIDLKQWVADGHKLAPIWVAPIRMQDHRPKALSYWESSNSEKLRQSWMAAIDGHADWAQLICWNDYTEAIEFQPSTGVQWAVYDMSAYYTTWFKTGVQPKIVRDVLYYFHRIHSTNAVPDLSKQAFEFRKWNDEPAHDEIELVAFLTSPGTLEIEIGGATQRHIVTTDEWNRERGIVTFRTPLRPGTPRFRLVRGGTTVVDFQSAFRIRENIVYQDFLYRAGSSARAALAKKYDCAAICGSGDTEACVSCPSEPVWMVANPP